MRGQLKKPYHGLFVHSLHSCERRPGELRYIRQTGGYTAGSGLTIIWGSAPGAAAWLRMAISMRQRNTKFQGVATSEMGQCRGKYGNIRGLRKFFTSDEFAQQPAPGECWPGGRADAQKRRGVNGLFDDDLMKFRQAPLKCPVSKPYDPEHAE